MPVVVLRKGFAFVLSFLLSPSLYISHVLSRQSRWCWSRWWSALRISSMWCCAMLTVEAQTSGDVSLWWKRAGISYAATVSTTSFFILYVHLRVSPSACFPVPDSQMRLLSDAWADLPKCWPCFWLARMLLPLPFKPATRTYSKHTRPRPRLESPSRLQVFNIDLCYIPPFPISLFPSLLPPALSSLLSISERS